MVPREPTEEMIDVFHDRICIQCRPDKRDAEVMNDRAVYAAMLAAAPAQPDQEPFAWFTEDYDSDQSATTYLQSVKDRWIAKGWPVNPLYTHPPAALPDGWFMTAMYLVKRYAVAAHNGNSDMEFLYQSLRGHLRLAGGR